VVVRCFANLYDGTDMLFITGRIGMSILCNFSCALSVAGDGFFCVRNFICPFVYNHIAFLHCFEC
jgi:hypothetical protein